MVHGIQYLEVIHGDIAEKTALDPFMGAEVAEVRLRLGLLFLEGQRPKLLPLAPVGKLRPQLRLLHRGQKRVHAAVEESPVILIEIKAADILRIG